ncbi:MAG: hypothetical protein AAGI07_09305, partial [Bacteroidota bacterium]
MKTIKQSLQISIILIKIRFIQFYRMIKQLGMVYTLLLLVLSILVMIILFQPDISFNTSIVYSSVALLIVGSIHFSRKDKQLLNVLGIFIPILYLAEYSLLTLPIFLFLTYKHNFIAILILVSGLILLTFTNESILKNRTTTLQSFKFLGNHHFEWIS